MKLPAIAEAGFDGVEIFEPDLNVSKASPSEIRRRCADLGLSIDLYQPLRDLESLSPRAFDAGLRRARAKFALMQELGCDLVLVTSTVADASSGHLVEDLIDDDDLAAEQLHLVAEAAEDHGIRVAYEALAWGTRVYTWQHSAELVRRADHPSLGLCLDSFHILARGSQTDGIADLDGRKIFFLQLSDAPSLDLGVLAWSRHHRLFPGQGAFDLVDFTSKVLRAGYTGPLSLEVFNDVFRQSDPGPTALDAQRSLLALQEDLARGGHLGERPAVQLWTPPSVPPPPAGLAFCELGIDDSTNEQMSNLLRGMGFHAVARHTKQRVTAWQQGAITLLLSHEDADPMVLGRGHVAAIGIRTADPDAAADRARAFRVVQAVVPDPLSQNLFGAVAPDATRIYFCGPDDAWATDFEPWTGPDGGPAIDEVPVGLVDVDHISMTQPFDSFDEARSFFARVVGLHSQDLIEYASPFGLLRGRAMRSVDRSIRLSLSTSLVRRGGWTPGLCGPQHLAMTSHDIEATASQLRARGVPLIDVPENYYRDLSARFDLNDEVIDRLRAGRLLYDRDAHGEFLHLYTEVIGTRVFFEVVQRFGRYEGYGSVNAPVHIAAHHAQQSARRPDLQHGQGMP